MNKSTLGKANVSAASKACRPRDGAASNLPHEPEGRVRQVTCCAESRASKPLVALFSTQQKIPGFQKWWNIRNFSNLPHTFKIEVRKWVWKYCIYNQTLFLILRNALTEIFRKTWKRWSNTLLKTVGDNYGKEEAKLKAEKVGCLGSNLRPMSIPSIWPLPLTFIWVEQSDEHTSNAHKLQRIIYER